MRLNLSSLKTSRPGLSAEYGAMMAQAAAVCLQDQGHSSGVAMQANGLGARAYALEWSPVSEDTFPTWADEPFATEQGAYAIAILLLEQVFNLIPIERSRKGTGFDYWLGQLDAKGQATGFFQRKARLEVSGIRRGSRRQIAQRLRRKLKQVQKSHRSLPGYAVIVEFGEPFATVGSR